MTHRSEELTIIDTEVLVWETSVFTDESHSQTPKSGKHQYSLTSPIPERFNSSGIRDRETKVEEIVVREIQTVKPDKWGYVQSREPWSTKEEITCVQDTIGS